ncbi:MAG: caspase family protein [Myxococcales bacterium]|nr:caspase family protein [Myxococcales bacterium]
MMIAALLVAQLVVSQSPEATVRRFALVAGANDGGRERSMLRYAATDARSVSSVLTQLGGVAARDLVFIEEPKPAELGKAMDELSRRLVSARESSGRLEVLFYYSGHSDETGLLLGEERYSYDELRRRLEALPAEVRIAIVDSCASGALTRSKGGVSRPPFLVDASTQLKGHAFLTSASIDEAAQESERLKASVFTHALVSGLRGAADTSRDGRVTLAEAYQFAFSETLARTASTRSGPQRPAFDIQLVGTGEMVLTDVRVASSQLELDAALSGRVFVLNANGGLVVEVAKSAGASLQLGVEPGTYRVLVDDGKGGLGQTTLALAEKQTSTVSSSQLVPTLKEAMATRGDELRPYLPVDVAFVYPLSFAGAMATPPRTNFSLGIIAAREGQVDGVALSSVGTWVDGPVHGLALAGVALKTGGLDGLGVAGAALVSTQRVRGVVLAPVSVVSGLMLGVQAGAVNVAGDGLFGTQVGAVNLAAGGAWALQGGAVNVASGGVSGAQLSAFNVATGGFRGLQAGAVNLAGGSFVTGAQVGVLNIGGDVTGAQVGVINIATTVKGTQIGVVNVAAETTAPVGLINIITQGRFRASVWTNETSVVNLAAKLGSRHVYSFAALGLNPRAGGHVAAVLGLGVHLDFGRFYGQFEADTGSLISLVRPLPSDTLVVSERLVIGYQFADAFSVFAGPSMTQLVSFTRADVTPLTPWGFELRSGSRLVPGFVIGAQLF